MARTSQEATVNPEDRSLHFPGGYFVRWQIESLGTAR